MTEQREPYNTNIEQRARLEIIRQDNLAIIVKLAGVPASATICKEYNPATQEIDPAAIHLWGPGRDMLLRYISVRQTSELITLLTEAVTTARRLDKLVKERVDFERVTVDDLAGTRPVGDDLTKGDTVEVEYNGQWYPATIQTVDDLRGKFRFKIRPNVQYLLHNYVWIERMDWPDRVRPVEGEIK